MSHRSIDECGKDFFSDVEKFEKQSNEQQAALFVDAVGNVESEAALASAV